MPTFECDTCGDSFNSKTKLQQHRDAQHTADNTTSDGRTGWIEGLQNMFTWKGALTLVGIILMIALPLGGTAFYSSLAPEQGDDTESSDITTNPPTGQNLQQLPGRPGSLQAQTDYDRELRTDEQLYLLYLGGPKQILSGSSVQPSFLVQYNCTDCNDLIQDVRSFSTTMNGGTSGGAWVHTAPNTGIDERIAVTFPALLTGQVPQDYDSFNATEVQEFICGLTIGAGQQQLSMRSVGPASCAF